MVGSLTASSVYAERTLENGRLGFLIQFVVLFSNKIQLKHGGSGHGIRKKPLCYKKIINLSEEQSSEVSLSDVCRTK